MDKSPLANQVFVVSGVLSTILSCGLGLGYLPVFIDTNTGNGTNEYIDDKSLRYIETAGEIAFVPSIVIIPFTMQKKGRRMASYLTILPLLFSWLLCIYATYIKSLVVVNVLHNIALGGAVTISSVIISEYCSPKYRATFLMLETAMISLGVLLSHISGMFSCWRIIYTLGVLSAITSLVITYFSPESPYWLISQGEIIKCTENFHWLRGRDAEELKELDNLLLNQRIKMQVLRPILKVGIRERVADYLKSLLKADFLKPLSIMILLFSFVGFGGENVVSNYSFRDLFKLTNGKYIGTIILDVFTLVCSLTACVLVQIVRRKTLFIFTSSFSIMFLGLTSMLLFLQTFEMFSRDYMWLFLSFITGFVMFMSLGTTALPFSLIGEIFPMSYKGIGSSLTCAYLWAFSNSVWSLVPWLSEYIGVHGVLVLILIFMVGILVILNNIMPETNSKTLLEIEQLVCFGRETHRVNYESIPPIETDNVENFDRLKLFVDV